jgi:hypothetical protein
MRGFRRTDPVREAERRLRAERPQAAEQEIRRLAALAAPRPSRRSARRPVMALAGAVTLVAALAAMGGVSQAVQSVKHAIGDNSSGQGTTVTTASASDEYATGACVENVNPHGHKIPPAGQTPPGTNPKSGQNPDGFYQVSSTDGSQVYVIDTATGFKFGPYPSGTVIKYTQATGHTDTVKKIGSIQGQAGAVFVHLLGSGDAEVQSVKGGPISYCLVPRPPK